MEPEKALENLKKFVSKIIVHKHDKVVCEFQDEIDALEQALEEMEHMKRKMYGMERTINNLREKEDRFYQNI